MYAYFWHRPHIGKAIKYVNVNSDCEKNTIASLRCPMPIVDTSDDWRIGYLKPPFALSLKRSCWYICSRWRSKNQFCSAAHIWYIIMSQTQNMFWFCSTMSVECTNPNLKSAQSAQLGQPAPKLELDLYIPWII